MNKTITTEELTQLIAHAQEDVAAMEAIKATTAASAYYAIQKTLERIINTN